MTYEGPLQVLGFPSYDDGTPSDLYRPFNGQLTLVADFGTGMIGGEFSAFTAVLNEDDRSFDDNVFGRTPDTTIVGNGFGGVFVFENCTDHVSCDAGNSRIGGALYGAEGERVVGTALLDANFPDGDTDARLLGAGTFAADAVPD